MKPANFFLALFSAQAHAGVVPRAPMAYQDYGELRLAVTAQHISVYDDRGTGAKRDFGLWHPSPEDPSFRALGSVGERNHDNIHNQRATLVAALNPAVKPKNPAMPALKDPTGWTLMWNDKKSGGKRDGSIWRPTCSSGYVSLGDVGSAGYGQPTLSVWCLRQDLAKPGSYGTGTIWDDAGSGAAMDAKVWEVIPRSLGVDGDENIPLYTGGIRCVDYNGSPREPAWTLSIDLPKKFAQFSAPVPTVTASRIPSKGDLYNDMQQAQVVLPLTAMFDAKDQRVLQYLSNPFARTTRSLAWYVEGIWQNRANGAVSHTDKVSYGISTTKTTEMEHQTGVSVKASGGIELAKFEVSLNYQFTYKTSSSTNEFTNYEKEEKFDVPPHYVTVMFCKRVRIQVSYVNGTSISSADTLVSGEFHLSGTALK